MWLGLLDGEEESRSRGLAGYGSQPAPRFLTACLLAAARRCAVYERADDWVQHVILDPVAAPPPQLVEAPGGRLVTVHTPLGVLPARSHLAVILAWAEMPGGGWACLLVWDGWRRRPGGSPRDWIPGARWSWVRYRPELVAILKPWLPDQPQGLRWFGRHHGTEVEAAYEEAAASLPEPMRAAALQYSPDWHDVRTAPTHR